MRRVWVLVGPAVLVAMLGWAAAPAVARSTSPVASAATETLMEEVRISGVVESGVETGCLLLVADATDPNSAGSPFLLLGGDRVLIVPGAHLAVTGELPSGVMSPCKQGKPLRVRSATPLPL